MDLERFRIAELNFQGHSTTWSETDHRWVRINI